MKKLISVLLAIVMLLFMANVAFANEPTNPTDANNPTTVTGGTSGTIDETVGKITINGATFDDNGAPVATYAIYQILKLNSFNTASGSYFYEYADNWEDFFTTGYGKDYVTLNPTKRVLEWTGASDAESVAKFAQEALKYAEANKIPATKTTATPADGSAQYTVENGAIVFNNLELGYYLVDSTVGALCGLTTTNPNGLINPKNGAPSIDKQVQEDLSELWGETNTVDIGQDVNFRVTIHVHDGAQNYVLHDELDISFTFTADHADAVHVEVIDGETGVKTTYNKENNTGIFTVERTDEQHFNVRFDNAFCKTLNTNDRVIVYYSAMLNENAQIGNGSTEDPANQNTVRLEYGENHYTSYDTTTTKTYGFDLVKTDGQNKLLDGSEFEIYGSSTGDDLIPVVQIFEDDNVTPATTPDGYYLYRKALDGEAGSTVTVVRGKVRIVGLDNGTYWLEETKAPEGYNPITTRQKFTISDNNLDAVITDNIVSTNSGVQVVNNTGAMLPETGGLGTILFTVLGGTTALGTGVVLVTKKRMSNIDED